MTSKQDSLFLRLSLCGAAAASSGAATCASPLLLICVMSGSPLLAQWGCAAQMNMRFLEQATGPCRMAPIREDLLLQDFLPTSL